MAVSRKTYREKLACDLTHDELIDRARALAAAGQEVEREQATQASLRSQMRSTMAQKLAKRDMLNDIVASSKEYRDVTVIETRDYGRGFITRTREDTGEIIESRPMVDDELQIPLDVEEDFMAPSKAYPESGPVPKDDDLVPAITSTGEHVFVEGDKPVTDARVFDAEGTDLGGIAEVDFKPAMSEEQQKAKRRAKKVDSASS